MTIIRLLIDSLLACLIGVVLPKLVLGANWTQPAFTDILGAPSSGVALCCLGILLYTIIKWTVVKSKGSEQNKKGEMYGLQHGRLHLQVPTPMWMNMGLWDEAGTTTTLAEACRDLLKAVLAEAGFSQKTDSTQTFPGTRRKKMLVDLGIGCGDQTIYLTSKVPIRPCDRDWWDMQEPCVEFDQYIGITNDHVQARHALGRVDELRKSRKLDRVDEEASNTPNISIFCADAAKPAYWNEQVQESIEAASRDCSERWVLALDTAYHFGPSRWLMVEHAHRSLEASFMAFDLCLSPDATFTQRLILRILTSLMGAPFANFSTPEGYRKKLIDVGYSDDAIKIVDISERVFAPLAQYLDEQDRRLKTLGLGIGKFGVAGSLFKWWGRSGVVRGVIVVAKR
ncbi:hypothetical protein HBI40_039670 [Parastagonospora nodorum]|nr:hypothetical protein HBH52_051340 [Parastagonospora nodorum]KAH4989963.1 hypothetical protein HBI76_064370 [Parastagonospora nodorum]KAH6105922.1 hypothetical protein HBI65_032490 [Parastagonospora nodorum]KAH6266423.1 hypothetical protein HBI41_101940 [Parastagonospora nodorum]KAH6299857.1 hypothetical protein HBI40_039670 [Parastagonospora nodorum]